jgi:hypothetical protein
MNRVRIAKKITYEDVVLKFPYKGIGEIVLIEQNGKKFIYDTTNGYYKIRDGEMVKQWLAMSAAITGFNND